MNTHEPAPPGGDPDPEETREWLAALHAVVAEAGPARGSFLLEQLQDTAQELGIVPQLQPFSAYRNSIPLERQGSGVIRSVRSVAGRPPPPPLRPARTGPWIAPFRATHAPSLRALETSPGSGRRGDAFSSPSDAVISAHETAHRRHWL